MTLVVGGKRMPVIIGGKGKGRKGEWEREREFGGKGNRLGTRTQGTL